MQPLYTQIEFDQAKSRDLLPLQCLNCKSTFYRHKNKIQALLAGAPSVTRDFCSQTCNKKFKHPTIFIVCEQCTKTITVKKYQLRKNKHHFCCKSCSAKYRNAHKTTGTRVSKLEKWLQIQLPVLFPNLEFHFNRRDAINSELDIYVPSLKIAFELNGIFHYEPIFGQDQLVKSQNNDQRKVLACAEKGIGLYIIDVSHEKYFKEDKSKKYLDIIRQGISQQFSLLLPS